ncbi:uncharacterized protein MELLADRAFT_68360 [Melampsora larici-populina 98AG31]|uniref:Uncharacterized protein n=1 Tax=Melampsora larici-populina (strain 98AG31 / pathotype 3-4-7) TaxID=747676 RepID=F4S6I9_MELLP|nr:uncharacterized protein MELLADRAFT_68360 [Melampsora larici-populina 98AG31]EGF99696.1 hypothetical protein MELLADRAFT_68360 [Melampsora larici-populina 98AG31]
MSENLSSELKAFVASQLAELKSQVESKDEDIALLRNQLNEMKMDKKSKASSSSRKATTTFSEETISNKASTSRKYSETPTRPSSKKHPTPNCLKIQQEGKTSDSEATPLPAAGVCCRKKSNTDTIYDTQDALFLTIQVLWGLVDKGAVPEAPDPKTLKEFYSRFTTQAEIESVAQNANSLALIAHNEITTLKDKQLTQKAGRGTLHLKDIHILFIHASLAKLGLRRWGPDLSEATDSLLNSACRISAILAFRQVAAGGAFDTANMDESYINNLRNHRLAFATAMNYQQRYKNFLEDIVSHSDDEPSKDGNYWIIKKLAYRSENATQLLRRLDQEIANANPALIKPTQFRTRKVPILPRKSTFIRPPQRCLLDTLSPTYFNSLPQHLKYTLVKTDKVIFLPNAKKSLLQKPHTHPGEKLSDSKFIKKYYEKISAPYALDPVETSSSSSASEEDEDPRGKGKAKAKGSDVDTDEGTSIHLSDTSGEDEDEACYEEGEFEDDDFLDSEEDKGSEVDEDFDPTKHKIPSSGDESSKKDQRDDQGDKSAMIIDED